MARGNFDFGKVEHSRGGKFPEGDYVVRIEEVSDTRQGGKKVTSNNNPFIKLMLRIVQGQKYANRVCFHLQAITPETMQIVQNMHMAITGEEIDREFTGARQVVNYLMGALKPYEGYLITVHLFEEGEQLRCRYFLYDTIGGDD